MSNPFQEIKLQQDYVNGHQLQWWIDPNFAGKAPYQFTVALYQDLSFTEPVFTKNVGEATVFVDNSFIKQNFSSAYMYKITLKTADDKEYTTDFIPLGGTEMSRHKYLMAAEMSRKEWLRLRFVGEWAYLLKRKVYSPAAIAEVDIVTGEPLIDSASGSFGTGKVGGYHAPVLMKWSLDDYFQKREYQEQGRGATELEVMKIRTPGFPLIEVQDLIVLSDQRRYICMDSQEILYPGTNVTLIQKVTMQDIPVTDTIYHIPVPEFPDHE